MIGCDAIATGQRDLETAAQGRAVRWTLLLVVVLLGVVPPLEERYRHVLLPMLDQELMGIDTWRPPTVVKVLDHDGHAVDEFGAPLRLTQLVLPGMRARGSGAFVAISSLAGKFGSPLRTGYCSAKFALIGYFDALRAETAHEGIEVFVVTPGFVKTSIAANALTADGSVRGRSDDNIEAGITADEAAQQILDGMAAGRREIPVGRGPEMAMLDLLRADPDKIFDMMAAQGKTIATAEKLP